MLLDYPPLLGGHLVWVASLNDEALRPVQLLQVSLHDPVLQLLHEGKVDQHAGDGQGLGVVDPAGSHPDCFFAVEEGQYLELDLTPDHYNVMSNVKRD